VSGWWPWGVLILLGAYHGVNPGMGWLFALSLGLQQRSRKAVLWALAPIALGHAIAIALTLAIVGLVQLKISFTTLKCLVAAILFALGLYRVFRSRHPRGAGMRVGFRDLTVWSFSDGIDTRCRIDAGSRAVGAPNAGDAPLDE
jgi:putative effector of murein hydrolase